MYKVLLLERAQEDLKKLDKGSLKRVYSSLEKLSHNPFVAKRLTGTLNSFFSYRFGTPGGEYRIAFFFEDTKIVIIALGPRENFYDLITKRL